MIKLWWTANRCDWPACDHLHTSFPTPRHMTESRCSATTWWTGCVAWMVGHCTCKGCEPRPARGPGRGDRCACSVPAPLV